MSTCITAGCSVSTGLQRCKQCKASLYCSKVCQRIDWVAGHHLECAPIAANPDDNKPTRKRKGSGESPKKLPMPRADLIARLSLLLMSVKAELVDLKDNPPQSRTDDFMQQLQQAQEYAEAASGYGVTMNLPVSGTLVPVTSYNALLTDAVDSVTKLYERVTDPSQVDSLTQNQLDEMVGKVGTLVDRVRSILLNPEVWLERNRQGSSFQLTSLPEDIVTVVAQKQRALEIDVARLPAGNGLLRMQSEPKPATARPLGDEVHKPVVSEGTVYRFFEHDMSLSNSTGQQIINYPASQMQMLSASSSSSSSSISNPGGPQFLSGLHGSLWEVTRFKAANFRWSGGQWHMIRSVGLPALGRHGRAVGVDKDNRLWMAQSAPPMVGMLRTDNVHRTPTFVSWALPAHYERMYEPTVTANGLVAIMLGAGRKNASKTGLVRFAIDSRNNHTTEELRVSTEAVQLANAGDLRDDDPADPEIGAFELSDVRMVGDRVSTQITVLDDQNQLVHVHDLATRSTETRSYPLDDSYANRQISGFVLGNNGRSFFVMYENVITSSSTRSPVESLFRLSV